MKLVKSTYNRVLTGVCGGIGNYLNIDPTVVRVVFAVSMIFSAGITAVVYLVLSAVIPSEFSDI
jgi:phage shock protein PspC (stress-responsive transcriptional regulator)